VSSKLFRESIVPLCVSVRTGSNERDAQRGQQDVPL
jgi:hypothetical protein